MMPERARESLARKPESSGVADELSAAPPTRDSSGRGSSLVRSHYLYRSSLHIEGRFSLYVTDGHRQRLGGWSKHFIGRL
jgi:hypothetical protein